MEPESISERLSLWLETANRRTWLHDEGLPDIPEGRALLEAPPEDQMEFLREALEASTRVSRWDYRRLLERVISELLLAPLPWSGGVLEAASTRLIVKLAVEKRLDFSILRFLEARAAHAPLPEAVLDHLREGLEITEEAQVAGRSRIETLAGETTGLPLRGFEPWSRQALEDIRGSGRDAYGDWKALLDHSEAATSARPSKTWLKRAAPLLDAIGSPRYAASVARWFPLFARSLDRNAEQESSPASATARQHLVLKGLVWTASLLPEPPGRALTELALAAYRKVPGVGPWAVSIGNAAVWALGERPSIETLGQLAIVKAKVKFGGAQAAIAKALDRAAEVLGLSRSEIEEIAVPTYGLGADGVRREAFGEFRAELRIEDGKASIAWFGPNGKPQKSVPKSVRDGDPARLAELKAAAKDLSRMLPVQAARIERSYLDGTSWPYTKWRERYADHPLVRQVARRLVWELAGASGAAHRAMVEDGLLVDAAGRELEVAPGDTVRLWHPLRADGATVEAWRERILAREILQPFKQAFRETYVLTDAERRTRTYSNRFAAHVLKQHQFHALCAARGWKDQLRLLVDDSVRPPSIAVPAAGLRAEFWVEGAGSDYRTDTAPSGAFLRLTTDQVRFYRLDAAENLGDAAGGGFTNRAGAEPLPLEEVDALVFSEVMRDVDLFVGVASIGNDPTWTDGGRAGRFQTYWESYSFGELGESAKSRKAALERLVPRLAIAGRCRFEDRWLVVRGDLRTYRIHLGSGNILMDPESRYLCIVPRAAIPGLQVFLPFEGDGLLSVILSKALLLADDRNIDDPTIVTQIQRAG